MRIADQTIGPRGAAVLAVAGIAGMLLGVHGWAGRSRGLPSSLAGPRPAASRPASSAPAPGPTSAHAPAPGPRLSSQSYARSSFLVWPGTPSAAARAAETGLVVQVRRQGGGILVAAGVAGQPLQPGTYYPTGAKVYIVEVSMGDDSGNADYNLGDDALVVTDAQGRILR